MTKRSRIISGVLVVILLTSVAAYLSTQTPKATTPEPFVPNGPDGQINQVKMTVATSYDNPFKHLFNSTPDVKFAGFVGQTNSSQLIFDRSYYWNGTVCGAITLTRPEGVKPWIIVSNTQGFWWTHYGDNIIFTVSVVDMDGTLLKSKSISGPRGGSINMDLNLDNLQSEVTHYMNGTIILSEPAPG